MDRSLKERLIGAAVLVALASWLIPWALNGPDPTVEVGVRETLELPAAQGSSAPVRTQTVRLDENRNPPTTPAAQIEANVGLSANPAAEPSAREIGSNLPSESQRLVEVENINTSTGEGWIVQLGSFSEEENARRLADRVATFGFITRVSAHTTSGRPMFRVRVGSELSRDRAMDIASSLSANGFVAQVITQD
jgi:DedD protein